jgi:hypothetical protein
MPSYESKGSQSAACFCVGPQNGNPLCPCRMRRVKIDKGRYIEIIDHGPVPTSVREKLLDEWAKREIILGPPDERDD